MNRNELIRQAFQELLDGTPGEYTADDLGNWWDFYQEVTTLTDQEDPETVRRLVAGNRDLVRILSDKTRPPDDGPATTTIPDLPPEAQQVYQHEEPCAQWLDACLDFMSAAAPMTPRSFHQAAALFMVSTATARRLVLNIGSARIYPNLYFLFLAPSTLYKKTTGMTLVQEIMQRAGIGHLLIPSRLTPEALVNDLDPYKCLPKKRNPDDLAFFLLRRAFAAQRGYLRDEVSSLFTSLKREFNAGLLELILEMYECPARLDEMTISRGDKEIRNAYLAFFGASTPAEMAEHLANPNLWANGLWARFAILTPDKPPEWIFFPEAPDGIETVILGLQQMYRLFPLPKVEVEEPDEITNHVPAAPTDATMADGVLRAWEAYSMAVGFGLINGNNDLPEELRVSYGRLGTMAMKTAMLLATMDAREGSPIRVELRHFARAQRIVEEWRASLHQVWDEQTVTVETRLMQRITSRLKEKGPLSTYEICRLLRSPKKETEESLELLRAGGKVIFSDGFAGNGRKIQVWQIA